jgi:hypothetical protein
MEWTIGKYRFNLRLVPLFKLNNRSSCECGEHSDKLRAAWESARVDAMQSSGQGDGGALLKVIAVLFLLISASPPAPFKFGAA